MNKIGKRSIFKRRDDAMTSYLTQSSFRNFINAKKKESRGIVDIKINNSYSLQQIKKPFTCEKEQTYHRNVKESCLNLFFIS